MCGISVIRWIISESQVCYKSIISESQVCYNSIISESQVCYKYHK